jgi:hypothetical protein
MLEQTTPLLSIPDQQHLLFDSSDDKIFDTTASVVSTRNPWWGYVIIVVLLVAIIFEIGELGYAGFLRYNAQLVSAQQSGYNHGVSAGYKDGYKFGVQVQKIHDAALLAKIKANAVAALISVKKNSYNTGKTTIVNLYKTWWAAHCSYDKTITVWVCDSNSP